MMTRWRRYRTRFSLSQRGLSLVEIMIVLVVVGLVLGASVVPFGSLWGEDTYAREREKMTVLQEAIAGYAASHLTEERTVVVIGTSLNNRRMFTLPAGRPYLPCPDIDGDGYEDRVGYDTTGEAEQTPAATLTVESDLSVNELLEDGNCAVSRGTLPWKTLGTPPADYWGSRYTYEVDDIFSNALIGFNQDTVIDSFDYREPIEIDGNGDIRYRLRGASNITSLPIERGGVTYTFTNYRRPIVVCDGGRVTLCQGVSGALPLEAGRLVSAAVTMPRRSYRAGDVIEGLPYVIVSHGDNRLGAVRGNIGLGLVCNSPVDNDRNSSAGNIAIDDYLRHEAVNFAQAESIAPSALRYCNPVTSGGAAILNGFFVSQPRVRWLVSASGSGDTFDDIVVWQTRQELTRYFTDAGILPAENFPVLRPY